ncbi:Uncharacterised protein [Streptococcus pneumoniae]|nr:hypothetical protein PC0027_17110 [Streptococcus pneumoniae]VIV14779.1 Uncharacterised protein [Streptococcus pneumoniae]VPS01803.1 Uncharacterised protein [Streptococcus pneumoniae]VPS28179.1 Uncharacterised protein [Streptococcus pneumoniae]VPT63465.1 Uncharacterised protein [Streptococcus pneumoniae]
MTTLGEDMEFWLKLYLISSRVVYVNRDSYIYRIDNVNRRFGLEKIRSDIQQILNFITFLVSRKIDTTKYLSHFILFLKERRQVMSEQTIYDATKTIRWIDEILFLLEDSNR